MNPRIKRLQSRIHEHGLDALLVSSIENIRYLFGFTGSNAIAAITSDPVFFVTDRRYQQQVTDEVGDAEIIIAKRDLYSELSARGLFPKNSRVGVEAAYLPVKVYFKLKKDLPGVRLLGAENVVEKIASVKDADEIQAVRQAGKICTEIFEDICKFIRADQRERDISAEISYRATRAGSERDPFEPIVASGVRSALPHGISSDKQIEPGDLIVIDFGAVVRGYAADYTRTVVVGEPQPRQSEMAQAVLAALQKAEATAKPGISGSALDASARDLLDELGFGGYFQHSLGHGLGLRVHELPRLGEISEDILTEGNVITLEPGVYIPDVGGVRIEDDFVVTATGVENLTPSPRELRSVG